MTGASMPANVGLTFCSVRKRSKPQALLRGSGTRRWRSRLGSVSDIRVR